MRQTISLTPSVEPLGLDEWFSGVPLILTGTIPSYPTMTSWIMQLWKYPHDVNTAGAEPVAAALGTVTSGTLLISFADTQLTYAALDLNDAIGTNNYYLTLGGVASDGQPRIIRAGSIEFVPCPFDSAADAVAAVLFTVTDDVAVFTYEGQNYTLPVSAVATPTGAVEGQAIVVDDVLIYTIDGVSYSAAVVPVATIPSPAPDQAPTIDYIVGSDGATYERTTTPEGDIYYQPVFTTAP